MKKVLLIEMREVGREPDGTILIEPVPGQNVHYYSDDRRGDFRVWEWLVVQ